MIPAFLLSVVFQKFVRSPIVSGPVSAEMSWDVTAGPVCDGGGPGSKDGAFGPPSLCALALAQVRERHEMHIVCVHLNKDKCQISMAPGSLHVR